MPDVATQDSGILSLLTSRISLPASVQRLAEQYQTAKPYPHVVLDGMFDDQILDRLVSETPSLNNEKWVENKDEHLTKYNLRSAVELADTGFQHVAFVHSAAFYICSPKSPAFGNCCQIHTYREADTTSCPVEVSSTFMLTGIPPMRLA